MSQVLKVSSIYHELNESRTQWVTNSKYHPNIINSMIHELLHVWSNDHQLNVPTLAHPQIQKLHAPANAIRQKLNESRTQCVIYISSTQWLYPRKCTAPDAHVNVRCHELSESLPQCVVYISSTQWVTNSMSHELNVSSKYHQLNVSTLAHPQLQKLHAPVNAIRHKLSESRTQWVSSRTSRRVDA